MGKERWQIPGWGVIISVVLHAMILVVLLVRLPLPDFTPPKEESVNVELVTPPEEEKKEEEKEKAEEKAEEQPAPEQKPAEAQQPEQTKETQEQPPARVPIPVLRPVVAFGEKDAGPRKDTSDLTKEEAKPPQEQSDTTQAEASEAEAAEAADVPEEPLPEAKKIFSTEATDNPVAMTAMGDLPRGDRVGQLCSSELYAQLRHGAPRYDPQMIPSFRLSKGTVLEVRRAAFYADRRWYDLRFRCEVDEGATRVLSFAFAVGNEVPKSEWRKRGFPTR
ncbi:DUF930 domain-containing protein [Sinorhizobium sp. BG8]|uniref:DUF930 domain-containing protein n=1 Tax=Sinorhizobium sp. BG8 TaxID=2613773 RepID=UPI001FF0754B|nr:DUF930 domain-containing protein [Sinorhizobium sp. BG8]